MIEALREARDRSVVASTAAGLVRMGAAALLRLPLRTPTGELLAPKVELRLTRDLNFTETQALAKEQEAALLYSSMQSDVVAQVMRRLAAVRLPGCRNANPPRRPPQHLAKSLAKVYTIHGDEPLLAQEAADLIRATAKRQGFTGSARVHRAGRLLRLGAGAGGRAGHEPLCRPAVHRDPHPHRQAGQGRLRGPAALLRAGAGRRCSPSSPCRASTRRSSQARGSLP